MTKRVAIYLQDAHDLREGLDIARYAEEKGFEAVWQAESRLVRDAIRDLRSQERSVLICTHNLAEAEELADQIAIIRQGQIIAQGTPESLKLQLLGLAEYEVRLACPADGRLPALPADAALSGQGDGWFRYRTGQPEKVNPVLVSRLVAAGLPVVSVHEVPRSLEQMYLQAMHEGAHAD